MGKKKNLGGNLGSKKDLKKIGKEKKPLNKEIKVANKP